MRRLAVVFFTGYIVVAGWLVMTSQAQGTEADTSASYRVYRASGQPATLDDVVAAMEGAEVVFLGEQHDDPVAHRLQAELLARATQAYAPSRSLVLSMEMFERDVQPVVDEYLAGLITESHFVKSSRAPQNYASDYRASVEFAREHGLPVLASNAPRRYVNRVTRLGPSSLKALPDQALAWLPPLPYPGPSPEYAARWNRMMESMSAAHGGASGTEQPATEDSQTAPHDSAKRDGASHSSHGPSYLLDAQALWDAAMASAIARHLYAHPDALVLHIVGSFHAEGGLGTPAAVTHYRPGTRALIVIMKPAENISAFEEETIHDLGDFVILTDQSLPRSFEASF